MFNRTSKRKGIKTDKSSIIAVLLGISLLHICFKFISSTFVKGIIKERADINNGWNYFNK